MEKIERIVCGNGNCYIISNGDNAVLVDTCREQYRDKILEACNHYKVRLLVLTHGHIDHVQNAAFLSDALGVPIAMHKADLPLIKNNMEQPLSAHGILGKIVLAASVKSFRYERIEPFTPTVFLHEGDKLEAYGVSARVVALPGHTKGSIGLVVSDKHFIVGDALMNMFYPTASMLYNDKAVMLQSAARISDLGAGTVYFGHGKPVNNKLWTK